MSAGASGDAGSFRRTLVYLVRHGQTPLNESGVLRGLADPPLDETGRRQAERLGAALGPRGLVSHDAVNREVLAAFDAGLGDPDAIPQDNGCYNTLAWRGGRWTVLGVNELPEP